MSEEITNPAVETELKSTPIKDFVQDKGYIEIGSAVRKNTNGYPFITFIDKDNKAENIYFSKKASANVEEGQKVTKELFAGLQVAETKNAEGEVRFKLHKGGENRISLDTLLS